MLENLAKNLHLIRWPKGCIIFMCDIYWFVKHSKRNRQIACRELKVPVLQEKNCKACVLNSQSCTDSRYTPGVTMHLFPRIMLSVRVKWIKFVRRHRVDFEKFLNKHTALCTSKIAASGMIWHGRWEFKKQDLTKNAVLKRNTVLL